MFRKTTCICILSFLLTMSIGCKPAYVNPVKKTAVNKTTVPQAQTLLDYHLNTKDGKVIKASVKKYAKKYNVEEELIFAIIMTESSFNSKARSSSGCLGLMQLSPTTFKARKVGDNIMNIDQNIHAGVKHFSGLKGRYKGDEMRALAAYNLGGGNVLISRSIPKSGMYYANKVIANKYKLLHNKRPRVFSRSF